MNAKKVSIIGSGIAGLVASATMAKQGYSVNVFEKNQLPGGRIRQLQQDGYVFDMGPSWYWMPDVFEGMYQQFGHTTSDFYELVRLDPSYTVFWNNDEPLKVPANVESLRGWMEMREPGSFNKLKRFLDEAEVKYRLGMGDFARRAQFRLIDFLDPALMRNAMRLDMFTTMHKHLIKFFRDPQIISLLSFPVLFLGGTSQQIPALYSLMNYADLELGTWYPMGGMYKIVEAWMTIAKEQGVQFNFDDEVSRIGVNHDHVTSLFTQKGSFATDAIIAAGDYHHIEQKLLPKQWHLYDENYWKKRTMAPSSLLYFVGVKGEIAGLTHHNLFFDEDLDRHADVIYNRPAWPEKPLFYACCPSKTDPTVAPEGHENLFLLIPVAPGLSDNEQIHERYYELIMDRMEKHLKQDIRSRVAFRRSFGVRDFQKEYNSYRGNAYGLANTLKQTAFMKPSMKHRKISNLMFAGQLTMPGPGLPPSMISGHMAAKMLIKSLAS